MANLLPVDVAQEAHFSNKDTWDSCQDGKQIKDVSKQSAKTPQCGVFFFRACHPWQPPFGPSLGDVKNCARQFFGRSPKRITPLDLPNASL